MALAWDWLNDQNARGSHSKFAPRQKPGPFHIVHLENGGVVPGTKLDEFSDV